MPRSTEARARHIEAVRLRDDGRTFVEIADALGYLQPSNARYAYRQGLALVGRASEVAPQRTRTVRVQHNNRTTTVTAPLLVGFTTRNSMTFGIELEIAGMFCSDAARAMQNAGLSCHDNGYDHTVLNNWKVVPDGSVNNGCEVVSPVLTGDDGLTEVRTVAGILRAAGATVNKSCGMHIHIGVDNALTTLEMARVIAAHQRWQAAFDALLTTDRLRNSAELYKGNTNYARKRTRRQAVRLADNWNTMPLRDISRHETRYFALNVNAFYKYGTFEVRSHQGSTNGKNATAWIAFNTAFMQWAKRMPVTLDMSLSGAYDQAASDANDEGQICTRTAQVALCKYLAGILLGDDFITQELHDYICSRAGNARNTQNGSN